MQRKSVIVIVTYLETSISFFSVSMYVAMFFFVALLKSGVQRYMRRYNKSIRLPTYDLLLDRNYF